jgi:hypothetical protein
MWHVHAGCEVLSNAPTASGRRFPAHAPDHCLFNAILKYMAGFMVFFVRLGRSFNSLSMNSCTSSNTQCHNLCDRRLGGGGSYHLTGDLHHRWMQRHQMYEILHTCNRKSSWPEVVRGFCKYCTCGSCITPAHVLNTNQSTIGQVAHTPSSADTPDCTSHGQPWCLISATHVTGTAYVQNLLETLQVLHMRKSLNPSPCTAHQPVNDRAGGLHPILGRHS